MSDSKSNEIEVRNLAIGDTSSVAQIVVDGWRRAYRGIIDDEFLDSLDAKEQAQRLAKCVGSNNYVVAVLDGEVVGFCKFLYDNSFSPDIDYVDCELTAIYVRPDLKGIGIGTKMFESIVKRFKDKNKNTMIVWCLADNVDSIKFYKHMGGEIREEKIAQIGNRDYREIGIVYNLKQLE